MLKMKLPYIVLISSFFLSACMDEEKIELDTNELQVNFIKQEEFSGESLVKSACVVKPNRLFKIKSRVSGEVESIFKEVGDIVVKGDVLAILDSSNIERDINKLAITIKRLELSLSDANLKLGLLKNKFNVEEKLYSAEVTLHQQELKRAKNSHEGALIKQKVDNAKEALVAFNKNSDVSIEILKTQNEIKSIELSIEETQLQMADLRADLEYTKILAPTYGTILDKTVEVGAIVGSGITNLSGGDILFEIADTAQLQLSCIAREVDAPLLEKGLPIDVSFTVNENALFKGKVVSISPKLEQSGGLTKLEFKAHLLSPNEMDIMIGMHAEANVYSEKKADLLTLPLSSIGKENNENYVFIKHGNDLKKQKILGHKVSLNRFAVTSGLTPEDDVAEYFVIAKETS